MGKVCLESKIKTYEFIQSQHLQIANELRAYCRKYLKKDYYLLKSIPGVGGYLASAILAEAGDIRRFKNESEFASYVGIVLVIRNSGGQKILQESLFDVVLY
jgi:transposase